MKTKNAVTQSDYEAKNEIFNGKSATATENSNNKVQLLEEMNALMRRMDCIEEERKLTRKALFEVVDATEQLIKNFAEEYHIDFSGYSNLSTLKEKE